MVKRSCPWAEDYHPKLKTHVSDKDLISQRPDQMQTIYQKTLNKLFNGVKNAANNNGFQMDTGVHGTTSSQENNSMKQATISLNGSLGVGHRMAPQASVSCISCVNTHRTLVGVCFLCSKPTCEMCFRTCRMCGVKACGICSEQHEDTQCLCSNCNWK